MAVNIRVVFSGLNLVVAKKNAASVAALAHVGDPEHYPMLIVPADQLDAGSKPTTEVPKLGDHIKKGWLPAGNWRAFEIAGFDLDYDGADYTSDIRVEPPGDMTGCPEGNWDDLGWMVPIRRTHPNGTFEANWENSKSVAMFTKLPSGSLIGAPPIDVPAKGLKIYNFGGKEQAFTDACLWKTASNKGLLTILAVPRGGGDKRSFILKPTGSEPISCFLLNHPKNPNSVKPGWHLGIMHEVFARHEPQKPAIFEEKRCRPGDLTFAAASQGSAAEGCGCDSAKVTAEFEVACGSSATITVRTTSKLANERPPKESGGHQHGSPEMEPRGEEYCAEGLIFDN